MQSGINHCVDHHPFAWLNLMSNFASGVGALLCEQRARERASCLEAATATNTRAEQSSMWRPVCRENDSIISWAKQPSNSHVRSLVAHQEQPLFFITSLKLFIRCELWCGGRGCSQHLTLDHLTGRCRMQRAECATWRGVSYGSLGLSQSKQSLPRLVFCSHCRGAVMHVECQHGTMLRKMHLVTVAQSATSLRRKTQLPISLPNFLLHRVTRASCTSLVANCEVKCIAADALCLFAVVRFRSGRLRRMGASNSPQRMLVGIAKLMRRGVTNSIVLLTLLHYRIVSTWLRWENELARCVCVPPGPVRMKQCHPASPQQNVVRKSSDPRSFPLLASIPFVEQRTAACAWMNCAR